MTTINLTLSHFTVLRFIHDGDICGIESITYPESVYSFEVNELIELGFLDTSLSLTSAGYNCLESFYQGFVASEHFENINSINFDIKNNSNQLDLSSIEIPSFVRTIELTFEHYKILRYVYLNYPIHTDLDIFSSYDYQLLDELIKFKFIYFGKFTITLTTLGYEFCKSHLR